MNIKQIIFQIFLILIFPIFITGCRTYVKPVDEASCSMCVNFIEDGKTKKEEVLQKSDFYFLLNTFKSKKDTILIFSYSIQDKNYKVYVYNLVLVFDENDVLRKHSVVQRR